MCDIDNTQLVVVAVVVGIICVHTKTVVHRQLALARQLGCPPVTGPGRMQRTACDGAKPSAIRLAFLDLIDGSTLVYTYSHT